MGSSLESRFRAMAIDLSELLALPADERLKLAATLRESAAPVDIGPLLRDFVIRTEHANHLLQTVLDRLSQLDETIERNRAEVREATQRSGEDGPFALPPQESLGGPS